MDSIRKEVVRKAKPVVIGYTTFNFVVLLLLLFIAFHVFDTKRILLKAE